MAAVPKPVDRAAEVSRYVFVLCKLVVLLRSIAFQGGHSFSSHPISFRYNKTMHSIPFRFDSAQQKRASDMMEEH
eukprot:scaffold86921_cov50-Prasinocladus_malaysianus.AAC.1